MTGLSTFGAIFLPILGVLWTILSFAVFNMRSRLNALAERAEFLTSRVDVLTRQQAETNQLLRAGFNIPTNQQ